MRKRKDWLKFECKVLKAMYPEHYTTDIAELLGRNTHSVYNKAHTMKLHKTKEFISRTSGEKLNIYGAKYRFQKGSIPVNKGSKASPELLKKMERTMFKKGHVPHNAKPVGYERWDSEGYLMVKADNERRMINKHVHIWELENGKVPNGMIVVFKNGNKSDVRIENLELINRQENMRRNTIHNLPIELKKTIMVLSKLKRKIGLYEKQN